MTRFRVNCCGVTWVVEVENDSMPVSGCPLCDYEYEPRRMHVEERVTIELVSGKSHYTCKTCGVRYPWEKFVVRMRDITPEEVAGRLSSYMKTPPKVTALKNISVLDKGEEEDAG